MSCALRFTTSVILRTHFQHRHCIVDHKYESRNLAIADGCWHGTFLQNSREYSSRKTYFFCGRCVRCKYVCAFDRRVALFTSTFMIFPRANWSNKRRSSFTTATTVAADVLWHMRSAMTQCLCAFAPNSQRARNNHGFHFYLHTISVATQFKRCISVSVGAHSPASYRPCFHSIFGLFFPVDLISARGLNSRQLMFYFFPDDGRVRVRSSV